MRKTKNRNRQKKRPLPRWYKYLVLLFLLHTLVEAVAVGTGPLAQVRDLLIGTFWVPEGWLGQPLPIHRRLVYNTLTFLWTLPFWDLFWWLSGPPMLGILAAVSILRRLWDRIAAWRKERPDAQSGFRLPPSPGLLRRWRMSRRLRALRGANLPQTETLCRRANEACLVQILSYSGSSKAFHLVWDLTAHPHWSIGKELAELISPAYLGLVFTRDADGQLGCFQNRRLLFPLPEGTTWMRAADQGALTRQNDPPAPTAGAVIQIHVSREERKEYAL